MIRVLEMFNTPIAANGYCFFKESKQFKGFVVLTDLMDKLNKNKTISLSM